MKFSSKNIMKLLQNQSIWMKLLLILMVVGGITILFKGNISTREGFSQNKKYVMKKNGKIYDEFYSKLFDELFQTDELMKEEIDLLVPVTNMGPASSVLEIGAGSGVALDVLSKRGIAAEGVEESEARIQLSKKKYPEINIKQGDSLESNLYPANNFSHILSLYFTLYYIKDKMTFFKNCYDWLMPGGYLVIHLVNRDKFDPLVPA